MVETHSEGFRWLVAFSNLLEVSYNNKKIINNIVYKSTQFLA